MPTFTQTSFWIETAERGVKSIAQAAVLALGTEQTIDAIALDYRQVLGMALGGGLLSVLTSIATANVGPKDSASMV